MFCSLKSVWGQGFILCPMVGAGLIFRHKPYFADYKWGHLYLTIVLLVIPLLVGTAVYHWKRRRGDVPDQLLTIVSLIYLVVAHLVLAMVEGVMMSVRS